MVQLSRGHSYVYRQHCARCNPAEKNSAIMNLYAIGREVSQSDIQSATECGKEHTVIKDEALLELLCQLLSEPSFDQLRTKEQLGYIVNTATTITGQTSFLRIIVQSNSQDPEYLDERIEKFLISYRDTLKNMTEDELRTYVRTSKEYRRRIIQTLGSS